jgi:hypothetical protein
MPKTFISHLLGLMSNNRKNYREMSSRDGFSVVNYWFSRILGEDCRAVLRLEACATGQKNLWVRIGLRELSFP